MEWVQQQQQLMGNAIELYYHLANLTEQYWQRDNAAALKIQSKFKMYVKRKQFRRMKSAAIKIETQFRAYYARKLFKIRQAKDFNAKNLHYFTQQAIVIQKVFRGFYVRKNKSNYYKRKRELQELQLKNERFKLELEEYGRAQQLQAQAYKQSLAKAQFTALAKNLHHLSSTKGIPGIYNSPFVEKPAVFEKTVQQHLKDQFKSGYRWRPPKRQEILKHSIKPQTKPL